MNLKIYEKEAGMEIYMEGELDHHGAKDTMRRINSAIDASMPQTCVLDMSGIGFMDSSGIAVVLGVYRRMEEVSGSMRVRNVPVQAKKVFKAAGVDRIVDFE